MTALDHARAYLARGWSIFPLVPGTKRPAVELAPLLSGERRMTTEQAESAWRPVVPGAECGIGIICGEPSGGLVVIDVDPRNGGDIEQVASEVRSDYAVTTGGGGLHLYMRSLTPVAKGKTGRPGVDRIGQGGYVVAPPTVTDDEYRIIRLGEPGDFALCPSWVTEKPAHVPLDGVAGEQWIAAALADPAACAPGTQDETLTRLCWWAAGHLDRDIADAILGRWMGGLTLGNPHQPWVSEDLRRRLDSAYEKRAGEFVVQSAASSQAAAAVADVDAIEASIVQASAFEVNTHQEWVVQNIAAPGCWTEIIGEVKKGKTTFNGQMIRSVLEGTPFLGWTVKQTPVLIYSEQVGLSLEATLERAGVRRHPDLYLLDSSKTFGKPWAAVVQAIVRKCQAVGARLLFVDTLTRLAGISGDGENDAGVVSVLDQFNLAKAAGIACVFVRHASKSKENREDASRAGRGSTAITGDMDIVVNLYQPGSEDIRRVHTVSRLGEEVSILLRYNGKGYDPVEEGSVPLTRHDKHADGMRAKVDAEFRAGNTKPGGIAKALGIDRKTAAKYLAQITGGFAVEGESSDA